MKLGAGKEWYSSTSFRGLSLQLRHHLNRCWLSKSIDSTGGWLGNPANAKVENNGAVVYVESSLTVHNALFFVHKLWLKKKKAMFQLVSKFKMIKMLLNVVHRQVHKNQEHITKESNGLHNHSTLITMVKEKWTLETRAVLVQSTLKT